MEIEQLARAFASGAISAVDLHNELSMRRQPIESDLESDLWALAFETGDGSLTVTDARSWLTQKYGFPEVPVSG